MRGHDVINRRMCSDEILAGETRGLNLVERGCPLESGAGDPGLCYQQDSVISVMDMKSPQQLLSGSSLMGESPDPSRDGGPGGVTFLTPRRALRPAALVVCQEGGSRFPGLTRWECYAWRFKQVSPNILEETNEMRWNGPVSPLRSAFPGAQCAEG